MTTRHLLPFFGLTFAITWSLGAVIIVFGDPLAARFGEIDFGAPFWKTLFHVATYAPAIAALIVVGVATGRQGLRAYVRRLLQWRVGLRWYVLVFVLFFGMHFAARAIAAHLTDSPFPGLAPDPLILLIPLFLLHLVDDPGAVEEIGWRGLALPLLQQRYGALTASVLLGLVWGAWHLPAFYISATTQSGFSFPIFMLGSVVLSIVMTSIYNSTGGNVILMFLVHSIGNFGGTLFGDRLPEQLLVRGSIGLVIAVGIVLWQGAARLGTGKVTEPIEAPR